MYFLGYLVTPILHALETQFLRLMKVLFFCATISPSTLQLTHNKMQVADESKILFLRFSLKKRLNPLRFQN